MKNDLSKGLKCYCPNCGAENYVKLDKTGSYSGILGGAISGAILGSKIGIAAGPLGAIAGTIPGLILGGIFGDSIGKSFDDPDCIKCFYSFKIPKSLIDKYLIDLSKSSINEYRVIEILKSNNTLTLGEKNYIKKEFYEYFFINNKNFNDVYLRKCVLQEITYQYDSYIQNKLKNSTEILKYESDIIKIDQHLFNFLSIFGVQNLYIQSLKNAFKIDISLFVNESEEEDVSCSINNSLEKDLLNSLEVFTDAFLKNKNIPHNKVVEYLFTITRNNEDYLKVIFDFLFFCQTLLLVRQALIAQFEFFENLIEEDKFNLDELIESKDELVKDTIELFDKKNTFKKYNDFKIRKKLNLIYPYF